MEFSARDSATSLENCLEFYIDCRERDIEKSKLIISRERMKIKQAKECRKIARALIVQE